MMRLNRTLPVLPLYSNIEYNFHHEDLENVDIRGFWEWSDAIIDFEWAEEVPTYTVVFKDYDGTKLDKQKVDYGDAATAPDNPEREGYVFTGWDKVYENVTKDLIVQAEYGEQADYTISFETADGDSVWEKTVELGSEVNELLIPTKDDYVFEGWSKDGTLKDTPFTYKYEADITLTAEWRHEDLLYEIYDEEVFITGYDGGENHLELPNFINERPVVRIEEDAFRNSSIMEIEIPANVRTISSGAFSSTDYLETVTFESGSNLETIEGIGISFSFGAFNRSSISSIEIPASVTNIGQGAFRHSELETLTFESESQLKTIEQSAFLFSSLTEIEVPASVKTIETGAFSGNESLEKVTFEKDSNLRGMSGFSNTSVTEIEIPASIKTIESRAFRDVETLEHVTFEEGIELETIESEAFHNTSLTDIEIPVSVTGIEQGAFKETLLHEIKIPANVTSIGAEAFSDTKDLETVIFESDSQLTNIGNYAFENSALHSIQIPADVYNIGVGAFRDNKSLDTLTFEYDTKLQSISFAAFQNTSLSEVEIPSSVTSIRASAFHDTDLETVNFSEGSQLETIQQFAFRDTNLTDVQIPANVMTIGRDAFRDVDRLTIYTEHEEKPDDWDDNWNSDERPVQWGVDKWAETDDVAYAVVQDEIVIRGLSRDNDKKELILPDTIDELPVAAIQAYAFKDDDHLDSIYIPDSVETIGEHAFEGLKEDTKLNVEATEKPEGWHEEWNPDDLDVTWGYEKD